MKNLFKNLFKGTPYLAVMAVSLLLLIFIGIGDANRVYPKMQTDKLTSLGEIVQNSLNTYLISGLPLNQFAGFTPLTTPLLESEESISAFLVANQQERQLFSSYRNGAVEFGAPDSWSPVANAQTRENIAVLENDQFYCITFTLENRFEQVGTLALYSPKRFVEEKVQATFIPIWIAFGVVCMTFYGIVTLLISLGARGIKIRVQVIYSILYLILAAFTLYGLITFYATGIQDKTRALAESLSSRLNKALDLGLYLESFSGLDQVLEGYRQINPDISFIEISENQTVLFHTDEQQINQAIQERNQDFSWNLPLGTAAAKLEVGVGIPKRIIYLQLFRSGKNFIILFFASTFMAFLFLNLLLSLQQEKAPPDAVDMLLQDDRQGHFKLERIRPLFFLVVFVEGLFVSFMPQFFQAKAVESGLAPSAASLLFTLYFASFVVSLLPSGTFADRKGAKPLLAAGALAAAAGYSLLYLGTSFTLLIVSRVLSGLGQGMIFIGVQSYILKNASKGKKTQGSSIIVTSYNGGMISGTAIGALLVTYLDASGVFLIGGVITAGVLIYALLLIKGQTAAGESPFDEDEPRKNQSIFGHFRSIISDLRFFSTILFVGIITKAVLTGVNGFALPLVLSGMDYLQEDIGQILIFYSAAVLISTRYASKIADRMGKTGRILFFGTQAGGIGLYIVGMIARTGFGEAIPPVFRTLILISGIFLLGLAHGFIHAPIVTHVAETRVAKRVGVASVTSLYRFMERIGHISGPILVGQLLYGMNMNPIAISWVGLAALAGGVLFIIMEKIPQKQEEASRV